MSISAPCADRRNSPAKYHALQANQDFDRPYKQLYDARPMSTGLPSQIDPNHLAREGTHLQGHWPLAEFERLLSSCARPEGRISIDLNFVQDDERRSRMSGTLRAELWLTCQRCMTPVKKVLEVDSDIRLLQQGEHVEGDDDVVTVNGPVSLVKLVEDELLLSLPMIPVHELDQCPAAGYLQALASGPEKAAEKAGNPFAVLKDLNLKDKK
ncbi:MAG: DUF177 domain-containing protein [Gammaproteobacteria bacterium]|nr:MAG: DUF177 domain-containing protein [Gammaproteobacteria bacterium]